MLISHKHKFIFIHIYKTAGTSAMSLLLPHARVLDRLVYDFQLSKRFFEFTSKIFNWQQDGMKQFTGYHKHAKAFEIREKMGDELFDSYVKIAFVRNPFDFLVSLYHYNLQAGVLSTKGIDFNEFVKKSTKYSTHRQIDFIQHPVSKSYLVDYVGRFETLEKDLMKISNILNIKFKRKLLHENPTRTREKQDYREYFNEENRKLVSDSYKNELELYGYNFEGCLPEMPLMDKLRNGDLP